jgi:hypothetical protein
MPLPLESEQLAEGKVRDAFTELQENLETEGLEGSSIVFWYDEGRKREDPNKTYDEVKNSQREQFQSMAVTNLEETRELIQYILRSHPRGSEEPQGHKFSVENPITEEELDFITQRAWNIHIERLKAEDTRMSSELVAELNEVLQSIGLIPEGGQLYKFKFIYSEISRRTDTTNTIELSYASFIFPGDQFPATAELYPDDLRWGFQYYLSRSIGIYEGHAYDEFILSGGVNTAESITRSLGYMKSQTGDSIYTELGQMHSVLLGIQERFRARSDDDTVTENDANLITIMQKAITQNSVE